MKDKIFDLQCWVASVKLDFSIYIANEQIPLEERWEVFSKAPNYLKEQCGTNIFDYQDSGMGIIGYECIIHVERYQVVDVVEKVQWLEELFSEYAEYRELFGECAEHSSENPDTYYQITVLLNSGYSIRDLKEHILKHNAGYFTYDW